MSGTVAVRFMGGPYDSQVRQIEAIEGVPPVRITFPVDTEFAGTGQVHYRPTGHMWVKPGEGSAHLFIIEIEPTQADLDTARPVTGERLQELRAGSQAPPSQAAHGSAPLDPDLTPFLDWPLHFPPELGAGWAVTCDNFPACKHGDCNSAGWGPVAIGSGGRMTIREFLADIKEHAEGMR